jgi:hypothetical protein
MGPNANSTKVRWDTLRRTCVFASRGYAGHVVHSVASAA